MQRQGRTGAGQLVHDGSIGELFFNGSRRALLQKLAESRARVGEAPRGNLDLKLLQRFPDALFLV